MCLPFLPETNNLLHNLAPFHPSLPYMGTGSSARRTRPPWRSKTHGSYPVWGVDLVHLRNLILKYPEFYSWNIGKLCNEFIKPMTKNKSYAEYLMLNRKTRRFVKPKADFFVSYAWSLTFGQMLNALEGLSGFAWIDVLALNQNSSTSLSADELRGVFGEALKKIGKVYMIATPWRKPVLVTRIWCVFEQYMASELGVDVELLLSKKEKEDIKRAMKINGGLSHADLQDMFSRINVVKAEAREPADQAAILGLLKGKETKVNDMTKARIKEWLVKVVREFDFVEGSRESVNAGNSIGEMLKAMVCLKFKKFAYSKLTNTRSSIRGRWMKRCRTMKNHLLLLVELLEPIQRKLPLCSTTSPGC